MVRAADARGVSAATAYKWVRPGGLRAWPAWPTVVAGLIDDTTGFRTAAIGGAAVPALAGALLLRPCPQVTADTPPGP